MSLRWIGCVLGFGMLLAACSSGSSTPPDSGRTDSGTHPGPDGGGGGNDSGTPPGDAGPTVFPSTSIFYQDISGAQLDPNSAATIAHLGSWGTPAMKIDFSMLVLFGDGTVPTRAFMPGASFQTPDCDSAPVPLPPGGAMEGFGNYGCPASISMDCHLLVYQSGRLWELFQATISGGQPTGGAFYAGCEAVWDLTRDYWQSGSPYSRGDQCAGADTGAGLPIAPLLVMGSELQAGVINHALRLRLPDTSIQASSYVHPSTHVGGNPSGDAQMPPLGARFRLRANYPVASLPAGGAQTVAVALQHYGMFLADDRPTPLTFEQSASQYIGADDLALLQVSDFEIVASPDPAVNWTGTCQRTPVTQ